MQSVVFDYNPVLVAQVCSVPYSRFVDKRYGPSSAECAKTESFMSCLCYLFVARRAAE